MISYDVHEMSLKTQRDLPFWSMIQTWKFSFPSNAIVPSPRYVATVQRLIEWVNLCPQRISSHKSDNPQAFCNKKPFCFMYFVCVCVCVGFFIFFLFFFLWLVVVCQKNVICISLFFFGIMWWCHIHATNVKFCCDKHTTEHTHTVHTRTHTDTQKTIRNTPKKRDGLPIYEKKVHQSIQLQKNCSYIHRFPLQTTTNRQNTNTTKQTTHKHTNPHKSEKIRKIAIFCSIWIQFLNSKKIASIKERKKKN